MLTSSYSRAKSSLGSRNVGLRVTWGLIFYGGIWAKREFITIMWFDSYEAVREFAGEDYEVVAVDHPKARKLLSRFDDRSQHYEVKAEPKMSEKWT